MMRKGWLVVGLAVLLVTLAACGGDGGGKDPGDLIAADGAADLSVPDESAPEEVEETCPSSNWVLEFFGIQDGMTIETGETMMLQARIFDAVLAKTVEGTQVTFSLSGDGDAQLLQTTAVTNDLGVASVDLQTGTELGVSYTLTASNPCVPSLSITLITVAPEQGSFLVTYTLSEQLTEMWGELAIVAHADNTIPLCGSVSYTNPKGPGMPLPAGESTIELTQIQANAAYVVYGIAYNTDGVPVGGGCAEQVSVLPDKTKEVAVTIDSLAMDPAGFYDLTVQVPAADLMEPRWKDAGAVMTQLVDGAGTTIGEKVLDDLLLQFPGGLPYCGEVDAAEDIQASIAAGLPAMDTATLDGVAAEADGLLKSLADNVVIKGTLEVAEGGGQAWNANWTVESVRFSGTIDCGEGDCESWLFFTPEAFGLGDVHIDLAEVDFEVTATGFDTLSVTPFDLALAPGDLVLFALTNIVLKKAGTGNELAELFEGAFSCSTLMSKVSAQTIACINKPQTQLIESCEKAVTGMAAQFYAELADYTAPQKLATTGELTSQDGDNDLTVDGIDGSLSGDFLIGTDKVADFLIPFHAVKK